MAASIFICFLAFLLLASTAVTQDTYQFGEMSGPVLLILGAGNRVGALTAKFFAQKGYRVALVSRSVAADDYPSHLTIKADLADPKSVGSVFQKVREALGEPNVVVYNAVAYPRPSGHLLGVAPEVVQASFNVNHISPVLAIQQAIVGFSRIPDGAPKVFLYTGNCLNEHVIPRYWAMGAGKSATAHVIKAAAASYQQLGFRFHYVDERTEEGLPVYDDLDGDAHAKVFYELVEKKSSKDIVTFSKKGGIADFANKLDGFEG